MALLLNPRVWIAIALAAALAFSHFFVYRSGKANVRQEFDAYKIEQAQLTQAAEKAARAREQALQDEAAQIGEQKDAENRDIASRLADALDSLSKRPSRPAGNMPQSGTACKGATGASLSAEDSRFLAGEAARADRLRAALEACYRQYDSLNPSHLLKRGGENAAAAPGS